MTPSVSSWVELGLGFGLLVLALRKFRKRPKAGEDVTLAGPWTSPRSVAPVLLGLAVTVLGAVLYHLVLGDRATATLAGVRAFMTANNDVIIMIVLLVFGAKLIGDGLSDLGG